MQNMRAFWFWMRGEIEFPQAKTSRFYIAIDTPAKSNNDACVCLSP